MSNTYTPRLTPPSANDKHWIKTTSGGYNKCIQIQANGSVLPNCTGYVHGRWMELLGKTTDDMGLSFSDAKYYYSWSSNTLERGREPRLGAILCQSYEPAGHVAVVEEIIDNNTIRCSESNYGGPTFTTRIRRREWNWDWISNGDAIFQGFIYLPDSPTPPVPPEPMGSGFKWWYARLLIERRKHKI